MKKEANRNKKYPVIRQGMELCPSSVDHIAGIGTLHIKETLNKQPSARRGSFVLTFRFETKSLVDCSR